MLIPFKYIAILSLLLITATSYAQNAAFTLEETTIDSAHKAILSRQLTCEALVNSYINRIKTYDFDTHNGPPLNAFVYLSNTALNEARIQDEYYLKNHQLLGPLHCIPVVVKDNIDTYDMPTSEGSLALLGSQPISDAFIIHKLRKAGAIILGKTTMDEFANGVIGVSSRTGRTGNAYNPYYTSGGSSSGSAVAISANFAIIGLGTDNSGSMRIPSAFNGLYTLRPSFGMVSQSGVFPLPSLDGVSGPMTRTVKDLAIVMDVIATPDLKDPKTKNIPHVIPSYISFLKLDGFKNKRIGILRSVSGINQFRNADPQAQQIYNNAFKKMKELGATIVDNIEIPNFDSVNEQNNILAGGAEDVNRYLASFPSTRRDYRDICTSKRTKIFGNERECIQFFLSMPKKYGLEYNQVLKHFASNRSHVESIMNQYHLDALIVPIYSRGAANIKFHRKDINCQVSSNTGFPSIVIIAGYTKDAIQLPVGLEIIGKKYDEAWLMQIAFAWEQNNPARKIPRLDKTEEINIISDIPNFNNFVTIIGNTTYNKFLKNHDRQTLSGSVFKIIFNDIKNKKI
jgi:amidase